VSPFQPHRDRPFSGSVCRKAEFIPGFLTEVFVSRRSPPGMQLRSREMAQNSQKELSPYMLDYWSTGCEGSK
jgi:hypothetical protein